MSPSGAIITIDSLSFFFATPSQVNSIVPAFGHFGTRAAVHGERLHGLGDSTVDVSLGGVSAKIVNDSNTTINIIANHKEGGTGDVLVTSNTGATAVLKDAWTYVTPAKINSVNPSIGQTGTRVVISGTNLYGGGVKVDTVVVCGIPVEQIVTNLADLIVVIVGDGNNLPDGDVVLTANTGAITSLTGAFTYIEKGYVASIAPNHGREGTRIAVTGVNLFGGGDYLDTISLAGFKATDRKSVV